MPERLEERFADVFERENHPDGARAVFTCKKCENQWMVVLDPVTLGPDKGTTNSLMSHYKAHGATPRMKPLGKRA